MTGPGGPTHLHDLPIVDRMRELDVPGVSVAIIEGGEVVDQAEYGVRAAGADSPVTPTTRFQACSISKPVTALAMLRLVEQGELDLDADINDRLVAWRVPPNGSWQPRVTLRQLASHSAGLTTHGFPGYPRDAPLPSLVEVLTGTAPANTQGVRVDQLPGTQFRYSGGGTLVMQLLLEEATGRALPDLVRELVLDPLGMEHSTFEQPLPTSLHDEAAAAHTSDGRQVHGGWHVYPEQAAAGLWTTPGDLARYAIALQRAAAGVRGSLVSVETATQILTPQTPPAGRAERTGGLHAVGLGPFVRWVDGETAYFGHSGSNEGFRCQLLAHRRDGFGAVVMTNGDGAMRLIAEAFDAIAAARGWQDYVSEPGGEPSLRGAELDRFAGRYQLASGTPVVVTRDGDRLDVVVGAQPSLAFTVNDGTTIGTELASSTISLDDDGLVIHQGGADLPCRRVDEGGPEGHPA